MGSYSKRTAMAGKPRKTMKPSSSNVAGMPMRSVVLRGGAFGVGGEALADRLGLRGDGVAHRGALVAGERQGGGELGEVGQVGVVAEPGERLPGRVAADVAGAQRGLELGERPAVCRCGRPSRATTRRPRPAARHMPVTSQNDDSAWENARRRCAAAVLTDRTALTTPMPAPASGEPQRDRDRQPEPDQPAAGGDDGAHRNPSSAVGDDERRLLVGDAAQDPQVGAHRRRRCGRRRRSCGPRRRAGRRGCLATPGSISGTGWPSRSSADVQRRPRRRPAGPHQPQRRHRPAHRRARPTVSGLIGRASVAGVARNRSTGSARPIRCIHQNPAAQ